MAGTWFQLACTPLFTAQKGLGENVGDNGTEAPRRAKTIFYYAHFSADTILLQIDSYEIESHDLINLRYTM